MIHYAFTQRPRLKLSSIVVLMAIGSFSGLVAKELKQTPDNTIAVHLTSPVVPLKFSRPVKFHLHEVIDRSGNPNPLLVAHYRWGFFLDREPREIVREALETSLKVAELWAPDETSADYSLDVYVLQFGLSKQSRFDLYSTF